MSQSFEHHMTSLNVGKRTTSSDNIESSARFHYLNNSKKEPLTAYCMYTGRSMIIESVPPSTHECHAMRRRRRRRQPREIGCRIKANYRATSRQIDKPGHKKYCANISEPHSSCFARMIMTIRTDEVCEESQGGFILCC